MGTRKFNGLLNAPNAAELAPEEIECIIQHGVANWMELQEMESWSDIANEAVKMALANYEVPEICRFLKVDEKDFREKVNVEMIEAMLNGEVVSKIYQMALVDGDKQFLSMIAERKAGWTQKKEVQHGGAVSVVPVLNVGLLSAEDEAQIKKENAIETSFEEV